MATKTKRRNLNKNDKPHKKATRDVFILLSPHLANLMTTSLVIEGLDQYLMIWTLRLFLFLSGFVVTKSFVEAYYYGE